MPTPASVPYMHTCNYVQVDITDEGNAEWWDRLSFFCIYTRARTHTHTRTHTHAHTHTHTHTPCYDIPVRQIKDECFIKV